MGVYNRGRGFVLGRGVCPRGVFDRGGGFVQGGVLSYPLTSAFKLGGGFDRGGSDRGRGFVLHSEVTAQDHFHARSGC